MKRIDPTNAASEYTKISTFMRGLDSRYKFHVRATNPATLANAVNIAKGYELSYNELALQPMGIVQPPAATKEITTLLGEVQSQIEALQLERDQRPLSRQQFQSGIRLNEIQKNGIRYSRCNKFSHYVRDC